MAMSLEQGLAAAQATVATLEADLVIAKATVRWFYEELRRRTRRDLEAEYPNTVQKKDDSDKKAKQQQSADEGGGGKRAKIEKAQQEQSGDESGDKSEGRSSSTSGHAAEVGAPPGGDQHAKLSKRCSYSKSSDIPADTCPVCWNEQKKGWAGGKYDKSYSSCRLNHGLSVRQAKAARLAADKAQAVFFASQAETTQPSAAASACASDFAGAAAA